MSSASGQWDDLIVRLGSGAVLAVVGISAMWAGGLWFHVLVALSCGVMIWELGRMLGGVGMITRMLGVAAFAAIMIAGELAPGLALPIILAPAIVAYGQVPQSRIVFSVYTAVILIAGYGLMALRDDFGFLWMAWLALVVIASDVLGYFAGRLLGGPKFWPRISPKKTWSGTVAGWVGALAVGLAFMGPGGAGAGLLVISVAAAMAAQMGDIAESAVKRHAEVKDSSHIIPGHGGLFDRFDGMLGASVFLLLVAWIVDFPPVAL